MNVEKSSQRWFGATILIMSIVLVLSSLGRADMSLWLAVVFSILLGLTVLSETGFSTWLKRKGYKNWSTNDFIVLLGGILGGFFILNGILLIQFIRNVSPDWLVDFISTNAIIGGIVTGIFAIFLIFTPKPKA